MVVLYVGVGEWCKWKGESGGGCKGKWGGGGRRRWKGRGEENGGGCRGGEWGWV